MDQRLLRLASEPLRVKALILLNERTAGPSTLAQELSVTVAEATRHLDEMHSADLIEVVGEELGVDSIEPSYRATVRALWDDEEWAELSLSERRALFVEVIQMIYADVCEGLEAGTFDARYDTHVSRKVTWVDEEGWRDINRIHGEALDAIFAAEERSAERLARNGGPRLPVLSAMVCGELPPRAAPPA